MGNSATRTRPAISWTVAVAALLLSVTAFATTWWIAAPAGPVEGCAWGSCDVTGHAMIATASVFTLGMITAWAAFSRLRRVWLVSLVALIGLVTAPFWTSIVVRGFPWGPIPL